MQSPGGAGSKERAARGRARTVEKATPPAEGRRPMLGPAWADLVDQDHHLLIEQSGAEGSSADAGGWTLSGLLVAMGPDDGMSQRRVGCLPFGGIYQAENSKCSPDV